VASFFPCFIDPEGNEQLMAEISKEELQSIPHSFKKDKIPRLDGLPIELFSSCFDFFGDDLLRVVEYTCSTGRILVAFNPIFIALIPKNNNPFSFHHFGPISLYNSIYKIISKIISHRI
jgi:hypothetical protein